MSTSARESSHWQQIRRDVDDDSSGLIRRYLRLSEKIVGSENEVKVPEEPQTEDERVPEVKGQRHRQTQAA